MKLAVFGYPIEHSLSPQIHSAFAAQFGRELEYARILAAPEQFSERLQEFHQAGGGGANVTVPLKEIALTLCDDLSERAHAAGAVNTLIRTKQGWRGDNTDGIGLVRDLQRLGVGLKDSRILILGAGGAVRGVIMPLLNAGVSTLHIANRTATRAERLAAEFAEKFANVTASSLTAIEAERPWTVIINATAAGLQGERPHVSEKILHGQPFCYDMVYGQQPTAFLQWAAEQNCATADGLGMLVEQAAASYRIWTTEQPQTLPVLQALRQQLEQK